jgi:DNA-binding NtrC family response regulator
VVSATNKNLPEEVTAGRFREDLLYRLNIVNIRVPPLKARKEDIPILVQHFLNRKSKTKKKQISQAAIDVLMNYDWPGNVRELEHVIEGATVLTQEDVIEPKDLWVNAALKTSSNSSYLPSFGSQVSGPVGDDDQSLPSLEEVERAHIEKVLRRNGYNRMKSAQVLGITSKTLYLKIKKYGIKIGS